MAERFMFVWSICVLLMLLWMLVSEWRHRRRVERENARRQREWREACLQARASWAPPPCPPNRLVWW